MKVSLCSLIYDVYYSVNKILQSPRTSLLANLKIVPLIRHDAANGFSSQFARQLFNVVFISVNVILNAISPLKGKL